MSDRLLDAHEVAVGKCLADHQRQLAGRRADTSYRRRRSGRAGCGPAFQAAHAVVDSGPYYGTMGIHADLMGLAEARIASQLDSPDVFDAVEEIIAAGDRDSSGWQRMA
jgi:hypothetical protein